MATAAATLRNTIDVNVRNMTSSSKMHIDISLREPTSSQGAYVHSYSTLDKIEGVVTINPRNDTPFDDLDISLIGK
jgi:hypothetical protein